MSSYKSNASDSRRKFLESTAAGAIGISTGMLAASAKADPIDDGDQQPAVGMLSVASDRRIRKGSTGDLRLQFKTKVDLAASAKLWLFFDIRQGAGNGQTGNSQAANFLSVLVDGEMRAASTTKPSGLRNWRIRTFDLLPAAPEFLCLIELTLDRDVDAGQTLEYVIQRWTSPQQPIDPFQFWLVVDHRAEWDFVRTRYKSYRHFVTRRGAERVATEKLGEQTVATSLTVTGEHTGVSKLGRRKTPGVFWGEFHGMVFNQRPLDDYYNYAKQVTELDFCAPMWFSYNTCIGNVWDEVKAAARRHTERGKFAAITAFECGTPPDGSHRCIVFRDPDNVPPIFCDERPPAQERFFQKRLHPDTIICKTVEELYETVAKYGGLITGHFHTRRYHNEVLCEMFQKNLTKPADEEQRLYELLREGKRFALAGTSDTHDSMPGNPRPEPHLPMAAGFTGVHAKELTTDALFDAVIARRIYATSGARIYMVLHSNGRPMGAELPKDAKREFEIEIDGTATLRTVELLRDGRSIEKWFPGEKAFSVTAEDTDVDQSQPAFYLVRVTQEDKHQGWTSPIWFG